MNRLLKWYLAVAIFLFATSAKAVILNYTYSGTCTTDCASLGLTAGDAVGGTLTAAEGFAENDILSASELTHFSLDFGSVNILGPLSLPGSHFAVGSFNVNPDLSLSSGQMSFFGPSFFSPTFSPSLGITVQAGNWAVFTPSGSASGAGAYNVPEPSPLTLLGLGLVGLGLMRRQLRNTR